MWKYIRCMRIFWSIKCFSSIITKFKTTIHINKVNLISLPFSFWFAYNICFITGICYFFILTYFKLWSTSGFKNAFFFKNISYFYIWNTNLVIININISMVFVFGRVVPWIIMIYYCIRRNCYFKLKCIDMWRALEISAILRAFSTYPIKDGTKIADIIPMIAITTIISIRVKAFSFLNIESLFIITFPFVKILAYLNKKVNEFIPMIAIISKI